MPSPLGRPTGSSVLIYFVQSPSRIARALAETFRTNRDPLTSLSSVFRRSRAPTPGVLDCREVSRSASLLGTIVGFPPAKVERGTSKRAWVQHDLWWGHGDSKEREDIGFQWDETFDDIVSF